MRRFPPLLSLLTALLLALGAALAVTGCDTNDEADREDFAVFGSGTWQVSALFVGSTELTARLQDQYESRVSFTFFEEEAGDRRFEIFARRDGENADLTVDGEIRIDADDAELTFIPDAGEIPNFEVDYRIEQNDRAVLTTGDGDTNGRVLRNILLPASSVGGEFPSVRLEIARGG